MAEMTDQTNTVAFSEDSIGPYTTEWDRDSEETPVFAVVSAIAEATGDDPLELPPLDDAIDPDALNQLFIARSDAPLATISFQYAGYDVTVRGNGEVNVRSTQKA